MQNGLKVQIGSKLSKGEHWKPFENLTIQAYQYQPAEEQQASWLSQKPSRNLIRRRFSFV